MRLNFPGVVREARGFVARRKVSSGWRSKQDRGLLVASSRAEAPGRGLGGRRSCAMGGVSALGELTGCVYTPGGLLAGPPLIRTYEVETSGREAPERRSCRYTFLVPGPEA